MERDAALDDVEALSAQLGEMEEEKDAVQSSLEHTEAALQEAVTFNDALEVEVMSLRGKMTQAAFDATLSTMDTAAAVMFSSVVAHNAGAFRDDTALGRVRVDAALGARALARLGMRRISRPDGCCDAWGSKESLSAATSSSGLGSSAAKEFLSAATSMSGSGSSAGSNGEDDVDRCPPWCPISSFSKAS